MPISSDFHIEIMSHKNCYNFLFMRLYRPSFAQTTLRRHYIQLLYTWNTITPLFSTHSKILLLPIIWPNHNNIINSDFLELCFLWCVLHSQFVQLAWSDHIKNYTNTEYICRNVQAATWAYKVNTFFEYNGNQGGHNLSQISVISVL